MLRISGQRPAIGFVFSKKVSRSVQFSADFLPDITKKPFFMAFCELSAIGILPSCCQKSEVRSQMSDFCLLLSVVCYLLSVI